MVVVTAVMVVETVVMVAVTAVMEEIEAIVVVTRVVAVEDTIETGKALLLKTFRPVDGYFNNAVMICILISNTDLVFRLNGKSKYFLLQTLSGVPTMATVETPTETTTTDMVRIHTFCRT